MFANNTMKIYNYILNCKKNGKKLFAILIDPDKQNGDQLLNVINQGNKSKVDFFFVGGSLLTNDNIDQCISIIKETSDVPVILFPGNSMQVNNNADGILFLSLISGRNAEMIIGRQVITAPILKQSKLEILSTGYMLIDSGKTTSASYISNTTPIPYEKNDIAICTAIAAEMIGFKLIFMDGGSGAVNPISEKMISSVAKEIDLPLIVGGGINNKQTVIQNCEAGADIIVVGNAIEKNNKLIEELSNAIHNL